MRAALSVLLVLLSLPVNAQGEGTGTLPEVERTEERTRPRVRAGISLVGATALSFPYLNFQAAPGLSGEVGVLLNDKLSIVARATVATVLVMSVAHLGVSVDRVVSDHVSLGVGLAFTYAGALFVADLPGSTGISLPVRLSWMFSERGPEQRARQGVYLFGEATPGVVIAASGGYRPIAPRPEPLGPPLMISAVVGIGYGWW